MLAGAWRPSPPPADLTSAELAVITPILLASGAAGLGWIRTRRGPLGRTPAAAELRGADRLQSIVAAVHERQIVETLAVFRAAGVEPLLVKGWAVARRYPRPGLRPYGDIDLRVGPADREAAEHARRLAVERGFPVDLRAGISPEDDRSWSEIRARSSLVPIGGTRVRIPGVEDHLRLLAVHMLKHGAWRPLWLCDVAALLESVEPARIDWDRLVGGDPRVAAWVGAVLRLAERLLGARLPAGASGAAPLPRWLAPAVLRRWGVTHRHREPLAYHLRHRRGILGALWGSWPDPITSTVEGRGRFDRGPRLPLQIAQCARRIRRIVRSEARP